MGSKRKLIHKIQFGYSSIEILSDYEILELMDYCLPIDVIAICRTEICRRREINLRKENK